MQGDLATAVAPLLSLDESAVATLKVSGSADFVVREGDDAWVTNEGRVQKLTAGAPTPTTTGGFLARADRGACSGLTYPIDDILR